MTTEDVLMDTTEIFNSSSYPNYTNATSLPLRLPLSLLPETYIVPIVFVIMFVVGLVGNGTVVYIFAKDKAMRTAPNALITSLAVGDLVVFLGTVPFNFTIYTFESWPYGEFICKVSEFTRDVSIGVTAFTLTVLSFDRYLAIAWPLHRHKHNHTKRFTLITIFVIWSAAFVIAFPGAYYSYILHTQSGLLVCYPFPDDDSFSWYPQVMVLTKFVILYAVPLLIVAFFYVLMARKLLISRSKLGANDSQVHLMKVRAKVAKIVLALVVVFAICLFPSHLFLLWFYLSERPQVNAYWHVIKIMGYVLTYANSCLNPLTLYFISGVYRNHYKLYLFWCCCPPPEDANFNKTRASSTRTSRIYSKILITSKV